MGKTTARRLLQAVRHRSSTVWILTGLMAAVGSLLHVFLVPGSPVADAPHAFPWWALAGGFASAELAVVRMQGRRDSYAVSLADIPLVLGLGLAAPAALVVGRLLGAGAVLAAHRRPGVTKIFFNLALFYLETVAALALFRGLLGGGDAFTPVGWSLLVGGHAMAAAVGAVMIATLIWTSDRRRTVRDTTASLLPGVGIGLAAGLFGLLFLIVLSIRPAALGVVALVTVLLYFALHAFGSLSNRHRELRSLHAFTASVNAPAGEEGISADTLGYLAETMKVDLVEIAFRAGSGTRSECEFSRLERGRVRGGEDDEERACLGELLDRLEGIGLMTRESLDERSAALLAERGLEDGLLYVFEAGELKGVIAIGGRRPVDRRFGPGDLALFETLASQAVANLERVTLVARLRHELDVKEHQRLHDDLTGLPNRVAFMERLEDRLRQQRGPLAVVMIDLDRFQDVNDTLGHHQGDALLVEVSRRLRTSIRAGDGIARMGGDEFAIMFAGVRGVQSAVGVARRIGRVLRDPFTMDGVRLSVTASTGVAIHPIHGADAATLLRHADMAMYAAKAAQAAIEVFDFEQDAAAERRLALVNDLRPAITGREIEARFQPKVEMAGGRTIGFEALARWTHFERGPISPVEFIPLAEHTGLITDLTYHMLDLALVEVGRWRKLDPDLTVSVNVPPRAVADDRFVDRVLGALQRKGVPASALVLEITESDELGRHDGTREAMVRLDTAGVRFSMDDFGTGYSSLSYLQGLPVREVKIDRSFVLRMADNPTDAAIVAATIQLIHSLGRRVVAEGVETEDAWKRLESLGCDAVQGFLVSRPIPAAEASAWVAEPGWVAPGAAAGR